MARSSLQDFETLSRLGAGSFGTVYKVRRYADDQFYVIKNVRIAELGFKEQTEAINEVQILSQLKSPYVVRYYDSFIENESLHIVMEFCNRGDLQNLLKKAKEKNVAGLKESVVWSICLQVILGLHYLHKKHILHRDLKCANVFLTKDSSSPNYLVKIGDLGVAKLMDTSTALASTIVGTPYYLSPELCKDMPYRDKSDCWALGVVFYECCTLQRPFEARNQCALIMKIIESPVQPPSAENTSPELGNLVLWLLQKDPKHRPSTRQILNEATVRFWLSESSLEAPDDILDDFPTDFLGDTSRNFKLPFVAEAAAPSQQAPAQKMDETKEVAAGSSAAEKRAMTKTSSQKLPPPKPPLVQDARIRGDRVRGATKRVPSERALNRYQRQSSAMSAQSAATDAQRAEGKEVPVALQDAATLRRSMKDMKLDDEVGALDDKRDDDDDDEGALSQYEDDFEEEEEGFRVLPASTSQRHVSGTGPVAYSAQSTVDMSPHLDAADEESDLWNSVWTEKRGVIGVRPGDAGAAIETEEPGNDKEGELGLEPLEDLIKEAKGKAIKALGDIVFWKVYDLCSKHMGGQEDSAEKIEEENAEFLQELERVLCDQSNTGIEVACEAVFGVKVLLALESKYAMLLGRTRTPRK